MAGGLFVPPIPREPPCHWCGPHPIHLLPCDRDGCDCRHREQLGIDTALNPGLG